jgi:hypothetical protein
VTIGILLIIVVVIVYMVRRLSGQKAEGVGRREQG